MNEKTTKLFEGLNEFPSNKKIICGRRINSRRTKKIICDVSNKSNSGLFLLEIKINLGYFYLMSLE